MNRQGLRERSSPEWAETGSPDLVERREIERGLSLLGPAGLLQFISPNVTLEFPPLMNLEI